MEFPLAFRHYRLLLQYTVTMGTTILGVILTLLLVGRQEASPCLLLMWHPCGRIAVRIVRCYLRGRKYFDLRRSSFPVFFCLHGGQKVTPFSVRHISTVLDFFIQFILNRCWKSFPCCNINIMIRELFVVDIPICLIILPAFHQRWEQVLGYVVHIADMLSVLQDAEPECLHNIIVNLF